MEKNNKLETIKLRLKAEELLKQKRTASNLPLVEIETLKLIHELEVHQIELEMQTDELKRIGIIEQQTAKKYLQLYDSAPVGYFTLSKTGEIINLNLSGATMLGNNRSVLKNKKFELYISNQTKPNFKHLLHKVMSSLHEESCEVTILKNSNQPLYVQLTGIVSENGDHCLLNVFDITERKIAEDKLKENEAILEKQNIDKDLFISILAHDLKNPFNSILGFLHLLSKNIRLYDIDKIESQINIINESAHRVHNLLDSILIWAKSQSGTLSYSPKNQGLQTIVNDVVSMLKQFAESKTITIDNLISKHLIVFADGNMLKTVLRNLISNAIKFTQNGGRVHITSEQSDAYVTITVSDTGVGLEPEMLDAIFQVSQMQTTKGTNNESGSGMGLLYCKNFIEKHGGTLWAESEKAKGSKFKFTLPTPELICKST